MKTTLSALLIVVLFALANAQIFPRWYFAGSFNYTAGATNKPSSPNVVGLNIQTNQFFPLGSGTNVAAFAAGGDTCSGVFFGGAFTTANDVATGPLTRYVNGTFSPFGNSNTLFAPGTIISSLLVDCPAGSCDCDVWIGGNFNFTASNGQAVNVARYVASSKTWDNLGGSAAHGIASIPGVQLGIVQTIGKDSTTVYFGGAFSGLVKSYTIATNTWNAALFPTGTTASTNDVIFGALPIVHSLKVVSLGGNTAVYMGGNFIQTQCNNFCGYYGGAFNTVGGANRQLSGPVYGVGYDNKDRVFAGGNFTAGNNGAKNLVYTTVSATNFAGSEFSYPGVSIGDSLPPVFRIDALDPAVYKYTAGSYAFSTLGGLAFFYNADVRIPFPLGSTDVPRTNLYYAIVNQPYNNAGMLAPSISLMIMCIFTLLFLFN